MKYVRLSLLLILLCGLGYPLLMTGISQLLFPEQAEGSIIKNENGKVVGSKLVGQNFTGDEYFHGRISSIEYDAVNSGSNNYAPSNKTMIDRTQKTVDQLLKEDPGTRKEDIPLDLITNSASGLDPHISPEAARFQIPRVAKASGLSKQELASLIDLNTEGKEWGIFGEPRVNVLKLNLAVNGRMK
ncbi:K+-transporting ATPase ATPase C chain [Kroppenstedtia sanguinis]|uniref:potassium-transporting ATPase subunit KdpC n=1 Tax=Kroppenstedtia sanguinis TaxID=1380684 RepID=UPI003D22D79E